MPGKNKPLVLITHKLPAKWINSLNEHCLIVNGPGDAIELSPLLIELLPKAEGLFTLLTISITKKLIDLAPNLHVISNMAVGVDNIDVAACTERGIPVGNTPGVLTESTADLTMALILSVSRNLPIASQDAKEGRWKTWLPDGWLGVELNNSILGIIGMGKIGQAVAKRAQGFGIKVLYTDPQQRNITYATQVRLDELLTISDIITLHAPLTPDTRGLINKDRLALMKSTAILINAARGPLVDTYALINALENLQIRAVALDVTDPEPLPPAHPLYKYPNCLIVPHIGSATDLTRSRMASLACENLLAGLSGHTLPNCVNPEVYNLTKN